MPGKLVDAFASEIERRDARRLERYFAEHVAAHFDVAGDFVGRHALLAFWRRLFQSYSQFELHILKSVTEGPLVIAESAYLLASKRGVLPVVRAITIIEVEDGAIVSWRDHADLSDVPQKETERWRRFGQARW